MTAPDPPGPPEPLPAGAARPGPRHGAPRRPHWGLRAAVAASAVILATSGIGHAVMTRIDDGIGRVDAFRGLTHRPSSGKGTNFLLVGTDGRDRISEDERSLYHLGGDPCHCTDTVMLVHLSADHRRAAVVSLPRDTYTEIPERTDESGRLRPAHPQKLNAAYAEGGPSLTVRAVEQLTGVHVDHFLEVDFASFMRTVDVLGGVRVCTDRPLKDDYSGLDLPAGTSTLNGGQALQYVRSRHLDESADLGRMQRQQRFVASLLHRATGSGVVLNPVRFHRLAAALLDSVRADRGLGPDELVRLARTTKGLSAASSEFASVPVSTVNHVVPRVGSTVRWDEAGAERLFRAMREDRPLASDPAAQQQYGPQAQPPVDVEVPPARIHVQVLDGAGRTPLLRAAEQGLRASGFVTTEAFAPPPGPAQRPPAHTVLSYDPRWDRSARSLAAALPGVRVRPVPGQGALMRVVLGADFTAVRPVRAAQEPAPPGPAPASPAVPGGRMVCPDEV
ncbi:LCP family protein [Streptomyces gamaensis]|uniref:LCP family protein n=1 Tax=Streptomyces gamaensis TaxID=1763542 RepID=A0ABW0Z6J1_9ACTN